ncbi:helix-turn-helix transcriptional regulator [Streptomyces sp. RPT161]|uniref:helix-turn-helix transcriptional regulator n=1 Tax=Streptomyces sp. RPT161 TaxID=3015993 RepID=UPI0022B89ED6|nr:LuxR family transcriptional regulator [Streptomyces sp. RPT161]
MREPALTGRDGLLETARDAMAAHRAVLFHGPAGIGRSSLLGTLLRQLPPAAHVLRCAPASEDAALPYVGLIDLLAVVPRGVLDGLPPEPGAALRAALLRGREPSGAHSRLAVRIALLEVLRRLADAGGVLLVVDDLQWLDGPSAEVLAFAMRRLDGADVRMIAAERVPDGEQPERLRCCPPGTAELPVPPLPTSTVTRLLRAATGADLPPPVLRAIQRTAAGNPLYALELARAVLREGAPESPDGPLPVPRRLRTPLLDRFRTLPEPVRRTLLVCSAAARPTLTVLHAAGLAGAAAHLSAAERLGVAGTDGSGAVRFRHPLIRAAVYADATAHARREAHAVLAAAVTEPVEQARHLALAHPHEDEATAATLLAAAASARRRGAPGAAAELAVLAARRTPADRPAEQAERWLAAADYACDAGQRAEADRAARIVLEGSDSPPQRVRARLVLLRNAGQALEGTGSLIEEGLHDAAQDPVLKARLYHWAALRGLLRGELAQAAGHAERAAAAGDSADRAGALTTLARIRSLAGRAAEADAALTAALNLLGGADGGPESRALVRMRAVLALDSDRVAEAHTQITELLRTTEGLAGVEDRLAGLVVLTRVQVRSGDCRRALRTAARCTRLLTESGVESAPALYAAALAATAGGAPQEARRLAERAVRASEADGDRLFLLRALAVLGQAALLSGDTPGAAAAVEALRRVKEIGAAMCAADPPLLQWYGDLAEALVMLGETDAAGSVIQEAHRLAANPPGSVFAALERAEGLREAALGRAKSGAALLRRSADRLRELPLPLELVRTLIALGAVERRGRHRNAARAALTEALETARVCGAAPLEARSAEELARLDAVERGGGPELTATEARIAALVGGGATNREVAAELFISVKTVEGTLSRVYRKFGVRSRTALAHAMAVGPLGASVTPISSKLPSARRELGPRVVDIPG